MYIRYYVLGGVFLLGLLFSSCGNSSPEEVAVGASSDAVAVVALDSAQLKMAGVETGQARLRRMAELIGSRGRVEAPPQSIASVYAPMSGFVRWVRHYPGDYVRKGTVLTELSHPDLVKLQGDFLECQSKLSFLRKDYVRKSELAGERIFTAYDNQDQEDEHSCFSDNTHRDIITNAQGIYNVYVGEYTRVDGSTVSGASLADVIAAVNPNMNEELLSLLDATLQQVNSIHVPFDQAIVLADERPQILEVVTALQDSGDKIAEASSDLGLTINTALPE